ncbi:MAG: hypothetical protein AAF127_13665 [Pseudomonadota bacterium]
MSRVMVPSRSSFAFLMTAFLVLLTPDIGLAHKLIEPGKQENVAKGAFAASTEHSWNRLSKRPGKYQEIWTIDGDQLNRIVFFGGVPVGEALFRERNKKLAPLPKVAENMLLPDITTLLERTYRTYYGTPVFRVIEQKPAKFAGLDAIKFVYEFMDVNDEVVRRGEAYGAFHEDRLYLAAFEAPSLHFFDRDIDKFRHLASTVTLRRK